MIKVFYKNRKTIENLAIALLSIGVCVVVFTGSWNAPETNAASSCCSGQQTIALDAETANDSCCERDGAAIASNSDENCCSDTDCPCEDDSGCNGTYSCPVGGDTCCYNYGGLQCACSRICNQGNTGCGGCSP